MRKKRKERGEREEYIKHDRISEGRRRSIREGETRRVRLIEGMLASGYTPYLYRIRCHNYKNNFSN